MMGNKSFQTEKNAKGIILLQLGTELRAQVFCLSVCLFLTSSYFWHERDALCFNSNTSALYKYMKLNVKTVTKSFRAKTLQWRKYDSQLLDYCPLTSFHNLQRPVFDVSGCYQK